MRVVLRGASVGATRAGWRRHRRWGYRLVVAGYAFTLITAHLKSASAVADADEAELRLAEGRLLREKIDARLAAAPETRLVGLGDFNDT